jgi:DNA polymerase-3 subunit gamma/tau
MADLSFLLSALSITGQCDINYKSAKNQRLHVELCLMKLANLPQILQLHSLAAVDETAKKKVEPQQSLNPAAAPQPAAPANGQPSNGSGQAPANRRQFLSKRQYRSNQTPSKLRLRGLKAPSRLPKR